MSTAVPVSEKVHNGASQQKQIQQRGQYVPSMRPQQVDAQRGDGQTNDQSRFGTEKFTNGAVAGLVGIGGGVVSGVINLESSGVEAPDWRPRHDKHYHEA
jgi:hypothetical protein